MKKFNLLLVFLLFTLFTDGLLAQNLNQNIRLVLTSYSCNNIGATLYEQVNLVLYNNSSYSISVNKFYVSKSQDEDPFYKVDGTWQINPNGNNTYTPSYTHQSSSPYLKMGIWFVEVVYTNVNDNKQYTKKFKKKANTFSTNMELEAIDEDNSSDNNIIEGIIINNLCYDLDTTTKEAKFRNNPQERYSGEIIIPESIHYDGNDYIITSIKSNTFSNNWDVISVTIPKTVKKIESSAFYVCLKMTQLEIADGLETIGDNAFYNCNGLSIVTLPNTVKTIERSAFASCYGLKTVVLGAGVSQIGYYAFQNCNKLVDFYCYAYQPPYALLSFDSSVKNATLHVPSSSLSSYRYSSDWNEFKNIIAITENDTNPTRINIVENTPNHNTIIYDLNGVRQSEPKKGINIINGKKVVIK